MKKCCVKAGQASVSITLGPYASLIYAPIFHAGSTPENAFVLTQHEIGKGAL